MRSLLLGLVTAVASCHQLETDKVKNFIPGTYFKKVDNEFSTGCDTLVISSVYQNVYRVTRYSTFNKIKNGKIMPAERRREIWTAVYNKEELVLNETKKGKVLSFMPDKNTLMVGSSAFNKIKN